MSSPNGDRGSTPASSMNSSPSSAPLQLAVTSVSDSTSWRPILTGPHLQVVLYNPTSHALTIRTPSSSDQMVASAPARRSYSPPRHHDADEFDYEDESCPFCGQRLPTSHSHGQRAPDYFHLLAAAHESESVPGLLSPDAVPAFTQPHAPGYFAKFFREEKRLGMGASGAVFLVQHVIDGAELGRFAVKKIAVGASRPYLLDMLREVQLLETLHHSNIVTYHHAWLEDTQWSSFQPAVQTLHILMQWADGGSLDDLIDARIGVLHGGSNSGRPGDEDRAARIRAHRQRQKYHGDTRAVHYFGAGEVRSIFTDIVRGLGFLHDRSILHLDLKPGNVLLTFEDGAVIPRALLSDFGTSQDALHGNHIRTGNTGTLEYVAPESLTPSTPTGAIPPSIPASSLPPLDSKADMWSLGMILYKMVFFRLPWISGQASTDSPDGGLGPARVRNADSGGFQAELEEEIRNYRGFAASLSQRATISARGLPVGLVPLLESLLHISPRARPTCERVLAAVHGSVTGPEQNENPRSRSPVTATRPLPPTSSARAGTVILAREVTPPTSVTPTEGTITPAPHLPALEWSAAPEQNTVELETTLVAPDDDMPSTAQSPDMAPRRVFAALVGQSARPALLALKIYTLARAQPPSGVTAFLAFLASSDLWPGVTDTRILSSQPWYRQPSVQREVVLLVTHFGILHALQW
ncbi:kinase-like protein [Auriculariales sp. MPI-PUGE-AT-0066]|nr:kinase-like protein [Auriculariales sp. MPI-PUGE-AT-0066]